MARSAGVVLVKGMILLTNTTRASAAASALPSSAEEGSLLKLRFFVQAIGINRIRRSQCNRQTNVSLGPNLFVCSAAKRFAEYMEARSLANFANRGGGLDAYIDE